MKTTLVITFLLVLIFPSCNNENGNNRDIISKSKRDGGIKIFMSSKPFDNQEAYNLYLKGLNCIKRDRYKCAKKYLEKALKIEPNNPAILCDLGLIETRLFNYDLGSELLLKAISMDSTYYQAYTNLGLNFYYDKKRREAIDILKMVDLNNVNQLIQGTTYFHLFMNYSGLWECDSAYKYYILSKSLVDNKLLLENIENFKILEFNKNCPQYIGI